MYWTFTLVNTAIIFFGYALIGISVASLGADSDAAPIVAVVIYGGNMLFSLAVFLPGIGVSVRRLHDRGTSGWLLLILFTGIGALVLLVFYLLPGTPSPNQYGPPPGSPEPSLETTDPAVLTVDSARRDSPLEGR
ncbi:MAG: DUF805 domain-containing protein [Myxococcales bacterium]|nr:DUF805 domain-containing protein [Myxococcales bacterium]